jgi:hypothetical protein
LGLDFVLVICTTEFSTFWKTSGSDGTEEVKDGEDIDCGAKVDCDCAVATFEDNNEWTNCIYKVLLVRIGTDANIINELTNNVHTALSFIAAILNYFILL